MSMACNQLFDPEFDGTRVCRVPNKNAQTKARASLPDVLTLKQVNGRIGIFTNVALSKATQFGPLEAPLVTLGELGQTVFPIKLDVRKYRRIKYRGTYDIYHAMTDENLCNWMMFVRPAKFFVEQNLCAHQKEDFIYFTTTRDIPPQEELKVWYSPTYARFMSVSLLTNFPGVGNIPKGPFEKDGVRKAKMYRRTQEIQPTMFHERDVRSVPIKKRGWRRTKEKRVDLLQENLTLEQMDEARGSATSKAAIKPHVCLVCQKAFKDKTKLRIHSVIHSNKRDFLCHQCGMSFKRQDKLNEHMIKVHGKPKTSKLRIEKSLKDIEGYEFKCTDCILGFKRRGMLIVHLIKKHPDISTNSVEDLTRPTYKTVWDFQCPYCEKVYKSSSKRKLHIGKQHPGRELPKSLKRRKGEPPCQREGAGIIAKDTVMTNPISCPHCDRQYSARHKRDKHIREKHPQKWASRPLSTNDLPPVYDVETSAFTDIERPELTPDLRAGDLPEEPNAAPSLYPMEQMPSSTENNTAQNEAYCQENSTPGQISNELIATDQDFLNHAMSEFEPSTSEHQPQQYQDFHPPPPPKESSYSRYPLGRKRMLRLYEDSQNQQLSHSVPEAPPATTMKQMPYKKARLLGPEASWRSETWQGGADPCVTNSITELGKSNEPNNNEYSTLATHQSLVSMLNSGVEDEDLLLNGSRSDHADHGLNDAGMPDFVDEYPGPTSWMYGTGYDSMNVNASYASR